jgi:hypothetical protein
MMKNLGALFLMMAISSQAFALSGNEIYQSCKDSDKNEKWGFCVGYVVGVFEQARDSKEKICVPPKATESQLGRVVTKWLEKNPDKLHFSASSLVRTALIDAFPCNEKTPVSNR